MKRSNKKSHQFPAFQNISDMSATFKRVKAFRAGLNLVRQVVASLLEGLTKQVRSETQDRETCLPLHPNRCFPKAKGQFLKLLGQNVTQRSWNINPKLLNPELHPQVWHCGSTSRKNYLQPCAFRSQTLRCPRRASWPMQGLLMDGCGHWAKMHSQKYPRMIGDVWATL